MDYDKINQQLILENQKKYVNKIFNELKEAFKNIDLVLKNKLKLSDKGDGLIKIVPNKEYLVQVKYINYPFREIILKFSGKARFEKDKFYTFENKTRNLYIKENQLNRQLLSSASASKEENKNLFFEKKNKKLIYQIKISKEPQNSE